MESITGDKQHTFWLANYPLYFHWILLEGCSPLTRGWISGSCWRNAQPWNCRMHTEPHGPVHVWSPPLCPTGQLVLAMSEGHIILGAQGLNSDISNLELGGSFFTSGTFKGEGSLNPELHGQSHDGKTIEACCPLSLWWETMKRKLSKQEKAEQKQGRENHI